MSYQELEINYIEYAKEKGITIDEVIEEEKENKDERIKVSIIKA